jgi:hypothetical protein
MYVLHDDQAAANKGAMRTDCCRNPCFIKPLALNRFFLLRRGCAFGYTQGSSHEYPDFLRCHSIRKANGRVLMAPPLRSIRIKEVTRNKISMCFFSLRFFRHMPKSTERGSEGSIRSWITTDMSVVEALRRMRTNYSHALCENIVGRASEISLRFIALRVYTSNARVESHY